MASSHPVTVDNEEEPPVAVIHLANTMDLVTLRDSVDCLRAKGFNLFAIDIERHGKVAEPLSPGTPRPKTKHPSLQYWVATAGVNRNVLRRFQLVLGLSGEQPTMVSCPALRDAVRTLRVIGRDDYPRA